MREGCIAIQEWFNKFYEKENAHREVMLQGIYKQTAQTVWINKGVFEENTWKADVGIYLIQLKGLFSFWEDTTKGATPETRSRYLHYATLWNKNSPLHRIEYDDLDD